MALEPEATLTPLGPLKTNSCLGRWQNALVKVVQAVGGKHEAGVPNGGPVSLGAQSIRQRAVTRLCGDCVPWAWLCSSSWAGAACSRECDSVGCPWIHPAHRQEEVRCPGWDQPLRLAKVLVPEGGREPARVTGGVGVTGICLPFEEPQKRKTFINLNATCFHLNW